MSRGNAIFRFGKVHFYEKTENGCVELSREQYNERNVRMLRTLKEKQSIALAKLLIMMEVPREDRLTILTVIDTPEKLLVFLDKLAEKNYEMTPQEVYQAAGETIDEML